MAAGRCATLHVDMHRARTGVCWMPRRLWGAATAAKCGRDGPRGSQTVRWKRLDLRCADEDAHDTLLKNQSAKTQNISANPCFDSLALCGHSEGEKNVNLRLKCMNEMRLTKGMAS